MQRPFIEADDMELTNMDSQLLDGSLKAVREAAERQALQRTLARFPISSGGGPHARYLPQGHPLSPAGQARSAVRGRQYRPVMQKPGQQAGLLCLAPSWGLVTSDELQAISMARVTESPRNLPSLLTT